jgi:hypothetical protein
MASPNPHLHNDPFDSRRFEIHFLEFTCYPQRQFITGLRAQGAKQGEIESNAHGFTAIAAIDFVQRVTCVWILS